MTNTKRPGGRPATGKGPKIETVVSVGLRDKLKDEAKRRELPLGTLIRQIILEWQGWTA